MPLTPNNYLDNAPLEECEMQKFAKGFPTTILKIWREFYNEIIKNCSLNPKKCLVIVYEDIKHDVIKGMTKILNFLGFSMDEPTKNCLLSNSIGNFQRKSRPKEEIEAIYKLFTKKQLIDFKNIYMEYLNELKQVSYKFGNETVTCEQMNYV